MTQHMSALFRSSGDAQDAQRALAETMQEAFEGIFLFELACRETLPSASWSEHEIEFAEYAAHGEQLTTSAGNRFSPQWYDKHSSVPIVEDKKTGHTLLVIAGPNATQISTICLVLEQCNAFALRRPQSRWRLCNSRSG